MARCWRVKSQPTIYLYETISIMDPLVAMLLPYHLLYAFPAIIIFATNSELSFSSTVFTTPSAFEYSLFAASESYHQSMNVTSIWKKYSTGTLTGLDNVDCINAYSNNFHSRQNDIFVFTDSTNNTIDYKLMSVESYEWICQSQDSFQPHV
jgi:hypothetical protein